MCAYTLCNRFLITDLPLFHAAFLVFLIIDISVISDFEFKTILPWKRN